MSPRLSVSSRPSPSSRAAREGFALIITIVLVAFLVLILVGLATFTRVETQVADNSQQQAKARQNALMALNIAIGQLQKTAGPDQRVTATAEVLNATHASKKKWTGVWNTTTPAAAPTWLVSGLNPSNAGAAPAATDANAVRLVGSASTDTSVVGNEIVVPLQDLRSNGIPGLADDNSGTGGHLIGRFGYWVGDEGVKARVNLPNPYRLLPSPTVADEVNNALLANRPALEWMNSSAAGQLDGLLPDMRDPDPDDLSDPEAIAPFTNLGRVVTPLQLGFLAKDAASTAPLRDALRSRAHDLTLYSAGVQADVRLGGLKKDLTAAFEMSDADFRLSVLSNAAPAADRTLLLGSTTNYAGHVFNLAAGGGVYRGPTWDLFRNHYRLYKETTPAASALTARTPRPFTNTNGLANWAEIFDSSKTNDPKASEEYEAGRRSPRMTARPLMPLINRVSIVLSVQTVRDGSTPDGIPLYKVRVVFTPYIVLHNPYSTKLVLPGGNTGSFTNVWGRLNFRGLPFSVRVRTTLADGTSHVFTHFPSDSNKYTSAIPLLLAAQRTGSGGFNNFFSAYIPGMTMEPGEVRVFSPDGTSPERVGAGIKLGDNKFVKGGLYVENLNASAPEFFGREFVRFDVPQGVAGALIDATDDQLRIPGGWPLSVSFVPARGQGLNSDFRIWYYGRNTAADDLGNASLLSSEIAINSPDPSSGEDRDAANYILEADDASESFEAYRGGDAVSSYADSAGPPTPIASLDVFQKSAASTEDSPARPFITSSPSYVFAGRSTYGNWPDAGNRRGYRLAPASWQIRYRPLASDAWDQDEPFEVDDENGRAYWGWGRDLDGVQQAVALTLPTHPLVSLAQFQNLALSMNDYEPALAVGNSYATPFTPPHQSIVDARKGGGAGSNWWMIDLSYNINRALWDSAFFSTLSPGFNGGAYDSDVDASSAFSRTARRDAWLGGQLKLPNPRVRPYFSSRVSDSVRKAALLTPEKAAGNLLVDGSFNVNSRSVDAWVAVLGGSRDAEVPRQTGGPEDSGGNVPISRSMPAQGGLYSSGGSKDDQWNGFTALDKDAIRDLASELVDQITARQNLAGRPFMSLAEFVNRRIGGGAADTSYTDKGVIQSAIDDASLNASVAGGEIDASDQSSFPYPDMGLGKMAAASGAHILQADVLQQIGPFLSARSDTFVIRTYGQNINPTTGSPAGETWCEAIVQRVPDFVGGEPSETALSALAAGSSSSLFGRRFEVVSFRWLGPEDL